MKKQILRLLTLQLLLCSCTFYTSQENEEKKDKENLCIISWNVQTFFDSTTDGTEYSEFLKNTKWNKDAYITRLTRLSDSLKILDADVIIMQEIENEAILCDIYNFMAGEWNLKKIYSYAAFAKDEGSSIGCAVLSRYPLSSLKVHGLEIRTEYSSQPKMRPLMELYVIKNEKPLHLFVNHWKSMSGGKEESEVWRLWQEKVLAKKLSQSQNNFIAGDFNKDILSFNITENQNGIKTNVLLDNCISVNSAWFHSDGTLQEPGSYYYQGEWSRIDQMFYTDALIAENFEACTDGPWCNSETLVPQKYTLWNGSGYSDHLPLKCTVWF